MKNSEKVNQILSWYQHENNNVQKNIERLLNSGYLGGTGKLVILPVDQGFEHGPSKSFAPNTEAYDPDYHFNFAIEAGCNAYAAPLGFLEHGAKRFSEKLPLILKLNNSDSLFSGDPTQIMTSSVDDAVRLGCVAVGFSIYPGSDSSPKMYEELRKITFETSNRYSFDDGKGEIGFISSISNPFCDNCTRARITADGKLVTCLFANKGMNLKSMLRSKKSNEYITSEIINMWKLRDDKYSLERSTSKIEVKNKIEMFQTGG